MKKLLVLICILAFAASLPAQNAEAIVQKVVQKLDIVKDYSVDAVINTDTDFLKAPKTSAKIYYKNPDKFKVESKSFAMLPKGGVNFLNDVLKSGMLKYEFIGRENKDGKELTKIKIIPKNDSLDIDNAFLWVDEKASVVQYVEASFEENGVINIKFDYGTALDMALPDKITLEFAFENFGNRRKKESGKNSIKGKITVSYGEYSINKGLSDDIFKDGKK